MGRINSGKETECDRREIAQVINRIGTFPHRSIARVDQQVRRIDFVIPDSRSQLDRIGQIFLVTRLVVGNHKGGCDIQVGISCTRLVTDIKRERIREPGHQSIAARIFRVAVALAVIPNTVIGLPVFPEHRNQHAVADTFRNGAATLVHVRTLSLVNIAMGIGTARPDDTRHRETIVDVVSENLREVFAEHRILCSFFGQGDYMVVLPLVIQIHR